MKKLLYIFLGFMAGGLVTTSCRYAPSDNPGDTVAASVFEPYEPDTNAVGKTKKKNAGIVKDSTDVFFVGDGSERHRLQLVSYPSKRDTLLYYKARHLKTKGNADYGHVVRVGFHVLKTGDSIVNKVEEVKF